MPRNMDPGSIGVPDFSQDKSGEETRSGYYNGQVVQRGDKYFRIDFWGPNGYNETEMNVQDAQKQAIDNARRLGGQYDLKTDYSGTVPIVEISGAGEKGWTTFETADYPEKPAVEPSEYSPSVQKEQLTVSPISSSFQVGSYKPTQAGQVALPENGERERILSTIKKRVESVPEYNYQTSMPEIPASRNIFKNRASGNSPESAAIQRALKK